MISSPTARLPHVALFPSVHAHAPASMDRPPRSAMSVHATPRSAPRRSVCHVAADDSLGDSLGDFLGDFLGSSSAMICARRVESAAEAISCAQPSSREYLREGDA